MAKQMTVVKCLCALLSGYEVEKRLYIATHHCGRCSSAHGAVRSACSAKCLKYVSHRATILQQRMACSMPHDLRLCQTLCFTVLRAPS